MDGNVFVIDADKGLVELNRAPFQSEDVFQSLLEQHPALLRQAAGDSRRLLLVRREAPVPEAHDSAGRWSLDHLFLDGDGVPVLVEVKRAGDTRLRREVVAQMLDYAANGIAYWPIEQISNIFGQPAGDATNRLRDFLGSEDAESFWRRVESNLKAGRVRMVFVADEIPKELRRIVEFLNEQMRPAEILAIEVEHFTDPGGLRLLTPRVVGATERAATAKSVQTQKPPLTEDEWLSGLAAAKGGTVAAIARQVLEVLRSEGFTVAMTSAQDSMSASLTLASGKAYAFYVRRGGAQLETCLMLLAQTPAFADRAVRVAMVERIKALPGVVLKAANPDGLPAVPLEALADAAVWEGMVAIIRDVKSRLLVEPPASSGDTSAPGVQN